MGSLLAAAPMPVSHEPPTRGEPAPGGERETLWEEDLDGQQRPGIDWLEIKALFIGCLIAAPGVYALASWFG